MPKVTWYRCPDCGEDYATWHEAEECMEACISEKTVLEVVFYECGECGKVFPTQEFLMQHELGCTDFEAAFIHFRSTAAAATRGIIAAFSPGMEGQPVSER
ncbi:C2H2-type zinc finger protein [Nitratidesulfovibrio liaohensis]|uniref:C2H2-type domain-containing protein n=1 Tax=Nitratidesulfovibrio liaohensis TaxID=2604158 RepID=A0ABY9QZ72_9BACT|nr:C2H2-type zinc finger protein [Nitratidesulfovibrio liaohensis]WMW64366.1 hypothetical protein KPS_002378 [Nitratidesulfovibrio liaohensis]